MSLIKKADVKNHLSARRRTEIHLTQAGTQADATGFAYGESHREALKVNDSIENPLHIATPIEPRTAPIVIGKSVQA